MSRASVGVVVTCPCGEVYELRPEYAGRLLECPSCRRHLRAGPPPNTPRPPMLGVDRAFDRDVFLLRQRVFTIRSKYEVWAEDGTPILYVERPTYPVRTLFAYLVAVIVTLILMRGLVGDVDQDGSGLIILLSVPVAALVFLGISMSLRPRRHVTVYRDDSRRETLLRVIQNQRVAFLTRTYTVVTASGETLAVLRKTYLHNLVRKRWYVTAPGGEPLAMAIEDSIVLSLLRRVIGPFLGFLRTNFVLVRGQDAEIFGEFNRKFTLLDRYVLDLSADTARAFDRRVAVALGVMLDTGERR
ncbi:MAG: hypothetical protein DME01_15205 [Candidatus Rokuibacteriota bacterium]|nr:MAG: hypothetical protein DME01_15205 [Candidatus Rokubacteria bacterium]